MSQLTRVFHFRRGLLVASIVAVLVAGGLAAGLLLSPSVGETSDAQSEPTEASADFWNFGSTGSEGWVPASLDELAEVAELIVIGRVADVIDGGKLTGILGVDTGLDQIFLDVRVESVVGGRLPERSGGVVRLDMSKSPDVPLAKLQASLPKDRVMFFLFDVFVEASRIAEAEGFPPSAIERYEGTFAPLSSRGIVAEKAAGLSTPQAEGGEALFAGVGSLEALAAAVKQIRAECDRRRDCLRDVLNPSGPFRGGLDDPYPRRGQGGPVLTPE